MREIKFRVFNPVDKVIEFVGALDWASDRKSPISCNTETTKQYRCDEASDFILMQFTGLKDKNSKEIFESDIVKWSDGDYKHPSNPRIAEVRFDPELSFFAFNVGEEGHKFGFSNFIYTETEKHLEIIGNRYQNPELLTN